MRTRSVSTGRRRRGVVAVLAVVAFVVVLALLALSIDIGAISVAKAQAQAAADAAALAAGSELVDGVRNGKVRKKNNNVNQLVQNEASQFAAYHRILGDLVWLDGSQDVTIGRLDNPFDFSSAVTATAPADANVVQVVVRADAADGRAVPLFFAKVFGISVFNIRASATVAFADGMNGVQTSFEHPVTPLLPFTFKVEDWRTNVDQQLGPDNWAFDPATGQITAGSDNVPEITFYPTSTSPGNWGTIDFGGAANSTSDLSRQILDGVNASDLAQFGGDFKLDGGGPLAVNGDTGISSAIEPDLLAIRGVPRMIPLYQAVSGSGNNAVYEIVGFAGVRVMAANLSSGGKYVIAQPAVIEHPTIVTGGGSSSDPTVRPVRLVR